LDFETYIPTIITTRTRKSLRPRVEEE
jgi:hypothetical protein